MNQQALKHLEALIREVRSALRFQSIQYHLFDEDVKVDTLNKMCPEIWGILSDALFDASIAAVGRLCDRDLVFGQKNITVFTVANEFDATGQLRSRVIEKLKTCETARKAVVNFRHKTVGHPDAKTRLGTPGEEDLVSIKNSQIDEVLHSMTKAVDIIREYAKLSEVPWSYYTEVRIDSFFDIIQEGQKIIGEISG